MNHLKERRGQQQLFLYHAYGRLRVLVFFLRGRTVLMSVQGKYKHFCKQVDEEEVKKNLARHNGGRLQGEQSPTICHSCKLQVANIHEGAQGY
jgi:hypothetical protein